MNCLLYINGFWWKDIMLAIAGESYAVEVPGTRVIVHFKRVDDRSCMFVLYVDQETERKLRKE